MHVPEFRYVRRRYEQEEGEGVLEMCRELVSVFPMNCIVAMLGYKRIGLVGIADAAVIVQGLHQAFYWDIEMMRYTFLPVFGVRLFVMRYGGLMGNSFSLRISWRMIKSAKRSCRHNLCFRFCKLLSSSSFIMNKR